MCLLMYCIYFPFSTRKEEYHCRKRKHRKFYGNKLGVSYNTMYLKYIYNRLTILYSQYKRPFFLLLLFIVLANNKR